VPETPHDEQAYRAGLHRAQERYFHDWSAEFDRRVRLALQAGGNPEAVGHRVHAEMDGFNRELRAMLADELLAVEAAGQGV